MYTNFDVILKPHMFISALRFPLVICLNYFLLEGRRKIMYVHVISWQLKAQAYNKMYVCESFTFYRQQLICTQTFPFISDFCLESSQAVHVRLKSFVLFMSVWQVLAITYGHRRKHILCYCRLFITVFGNLTADLHTH